MFSHWFAESVVVVVVVVFCVVPSLVYASSIFNCNIAVVLFVMQMALAIARVHPVHWLMHLRYIHPFNGPFSGTTRVGRYQKGKTNLDFTEARDNEWQWHQLGHMQVCTSLQTDNHASTSPLSFLQAWCPSCHPTNSVKALKATDNASQIVMVKSTWIDLPGQIEWNRTVESTL